MYEKDLQIEDNNPQWIKFVDYFNEFWKEKFGERSPFEYESRFDNVHIISKHMWFIEWLFNKGKLRRDCVMQYDNKMGDKLVQWGAFNQSLSLIAYLSIQDNPITFILEILE